MVEILIVEDEPPAARRLVSLVEAHLPSPAVHFAASLPAARALMTDHCFEIICLDLNLHGEDGYQILRDLSVTSAVIVVSAHVDRALEAFDHGVVDFVPKPVTAERFRLALDRARTNRLTSTPDTVPETIAFRSQRGIEIVPLGDIVSVSAVGDYAEITLSDGRTHIDDRSLSDLEARSGGQLIRLHRSHLAGQGHIKEISFSEGSATAQLSNGTSLPIARRKLNLVKIAIAQN